MTLNELMLVSQIETMQRLQPAWIELEGQRYIIGDPEPPGHGLRHAMAAALVRLGMMLDRNAIEMPPATRQSSGNKGVRHAL